MQPRVAAAIHDRVVAATSPPQSRALVALAVTTAAEARDAAERELRRAPSCGCCLSARVHFSKLVGSTLFLDDDPASLRRAIPFAERARWSERLVAALIVRFGRARTSLFGRS